MGESFWCLRKIWYDWKHDGSLLWNPTSCSSPSQDFVYGRVCQKKSCEESQKIVYICRYPPINLTKIKGFYSRNQKKSDFSYWVILSCMGNTCKICEKDDS